MSNSFYKFFKYVLESVLLGAVAFEFFIFY
jgi:hypothetical protein